MDLLADTLDGMRGAWAHLFDGAAEHRLQMLVTPLRLGGVWLEEPRTESFRADAEYFYPASTVKLLAAVAAARWTRMTGDVAAEAGPLLDAPLAFHRDDGSVLATDETNPAPGHPITLRHCIRRALVVSENEPHNLVYDFLGHAVVNFELASMGLTDAVINHRLDDPRPPAAHRIKPMVAVTLDNCEVEFERREDPPISSGFFAALRGTKVGTAHMRHGELIDAPMDFAAPGAEKNRVRLADLHSIVRRFAPGTRAMDRSNAEALGVSVADHAFLRRCLSVLPRECDAPRYDPVTCLHSLSQSE